MNVEMKGGRVPSHDELFRRTFRDSPIGMVILDEVGNYVEVNAAFAHMLGYAVDEFRGRHFAEYTHPDDLPRDVEMLGKLGTGEVPYFQVQKRYAHRSGDTVWARVTVSVVNVEGNGAERHLVAQVEDITEIRHTRELLEWRALYDHLTGLANRTLLLDRLEHALSSHDGRAATVACIFLDVDHFKLVNDSLGHEAGDHLLVKIAQRIQDAVRSGDTVARFGGDEFVIVLENVMSQAVAEGLLAVITAAVQAPVMIEGHEVVPTVSAGLALAGADTTAEGLVRDADLAMYAAKQAGRARVEIFDESMRHMALTKLSIEAELRTAIRGGELVVHYQPVVELESRRVVGFEALVRWQHPQRGLLLPDQFIPICEEANLVVPLGSIVLHDACGFIARHPEFTGKIFVNVSTKQIGAADLNRVVKAALAATGIDASRLGLEITESGVLMASAAAFADITALADMGVDLVLDDFGTGYSALSTVLQNPIAGLKLAREFTLRLGDHSTGDRISTAMANLTNSLAMYGVIEGIETEAQYEIAKRHGWALGQGFLFGHPIPEDQIVFDEAGEVVLAAHATR